MEKSLSQYIIVDNKIKFRKEKWSKFVDIATVIWLIIFITGFFSTEKIAPICNILNIVILTIFVADLVVIYISSSNRHTFLRKHWFDILMIIPYFRVFRIFRVFRLLKIVRIVKVTRVAKTAKMATKATKFGLKLHMQAKHKTEEKETHPNSEKPTSEQEKIGQPTDKIQGKE